MIKTLLVHSKHDGTDKIFVPHAKHSGVDKRFVVNQKYGTLMLNIDFTQVVPTDSVSGNPVTWYTSNYWTSEGCILNPAQSTNSYYCATVPLSADLKNKIVNSTKYVVEYCAEVLSYRSTSQDNNNYFDMGGLGYSQRNLPPRGFGSIYWQTNTNFHQVPPNTWVNVKIEVDGYTSVITIGGESKTYTNNISFSLPYFKYNQASTFATKLANNVITIGSRWLTSNTAIGKIKSLSITYID